MLLGGINFNDFKNAMNIDDEKRTALINASITCECINLQKIYESILRKSIESESHI